MQPKEESLCFEDTSLSSQLDLVVPKKQQAKHLILHIALNFLTRIWEKLTPATGKMHIRPRPLVPVTALPGTNVQI